MLAKNSDAVSFAVAVVWVGIKCVILVKVSTTTKIASYSSDVVGKATMKSIEIVCQGRSRIGRGNSKPALR